MNYLFFFVHPSKYKVFRATINELKSTGNHVDVVITTKDVLEELVKNEGWEYTNIFPQGRKIPDIPVKLSAAINACRTVFRLERFIRKKRVKYDLFVTDDLLVVNGRIHNVPSVFFIDDDLEIIPEISILLAMAKYVLAPSVTKLGRFQNKVIPFWGYKELGGLHPSRYVPDKKTLSHYMIDADKPFFLIRLVSLKAVHDINKKGLNNEDVHRLIAMLSDFGKVYITSERSLPEEFESYRLKIKANDMPAFLYYAKMLISDSQTMSAEAGVLGTPYIRYNDFVGRISSLAELENKYHLGIGIKTNEKEKLFDTVKSMLDNPNIKEEWQEKRNIMLNEKVDLTSLMLWLFRDVKNHSKIIKDDPTYQKQFIVHVDH